MARGCFSVVQRALRKFRGAKAKYVVVEDNDPTGYKSKKACAAKCELGINAIAFPKYSPDLNPLDYVLWDAVERRMAKTAAGATTVAAFKKKLRRVAMSIPESEIREAVLAIKKRAKAIHEAQGGDIPRD